MITSPTSRFSDRFSEDQLLYMAAGTFTLGSVSNILLVILISLIDGTINLAPLIALVMLLLVVPLLFMGRVWIHRRWGFLDGVNYQYYLDLTWLLIALITSLPGIPFRFIATGFLIGMRHGFIDEDSETGARLAVVTCIMLLTAPILGLLSYLLVFLAGVKGIFLQAMELFVLQLTRSSLFLLVFILIPIRLLEGRRIYDWNQGLFFLLVAIAVSWILFSPFGYIPLLSLPKT